MGKAGEGAEKEEQQAEEEERQEGEEQEQEEDEKEERLWRKAQTPACLSVSLPRDTFNVLRGRRRGAA